MSGLPSGPGPQSTPVAIQMHEGSMCVHFFHLACALWPGSTSMSVTRTQLRAAPKGVQGEGGGVHTWRSVHEL